MIARKAYRVVGIYIEKEWEGNRDREKGKEERREFVCEREKKSCRYKERERDKRYEKGGWERERDKGRDLEKEREERERDKGERESREVYMYIKRGKKRRKMGRKREIVRERKIEVLRFIPREGKKRRERERGGQ
jgi:hypothetical protein